MNAKKIARNVAVYFAALVVGVVIAAGTVLPVALSIIEMLEK